MDNGHLSIEELEQLSQQKGPAENQSHIASCRQCHILLEKYQAVSEKLDQLASARIGARNGMNCPDERIWLDVAGGTLPSEESLKYIQHASECTSCAHRLRAATRIFQEELSPEEEKTIEALPSAGAKQRKRLAQQLADKANAGHSGREEISPKRKRSFWWPFSLSIAGAAVVVAIIFSTIPRNSPAAVDQLLAQAYTENRTIEMRIPGAKHGDIRQQRSGTVGSILNNSEAARSAQDKISTALKKDPGNPQWLILQAQLDLLDWRYQAAASELKKMIQTGADSTSFLLMRALVLYEQGQDEHDQQLQNEAVDLLGRILQREPTNSIALFDQALACEDLYNYVCAAKDWNQLLQVEKDQGWTAEARRHLNQIQEKKTPMPRP